MTRGPRKQPALVVLALLGAVALVVWLARTDEDGHAPARSGPRHVRTRRTTPVVELAPPSASSSSTIVAPRTVVTAAAGAPGAPGVDSVGARIEELRVAPGELDTPSLRAVRGLVRDARTSLPIAHAWLTWEAPGEKFSTFVDEVLGGFGPEDVATGMVTGADGRFDVDRMVAKDQVYSTLHAVAAGYAAMALRPGLREEVVFDLEPMGSLEVRLGGQSEEDRLRRTVASRGRTVTIEPVPDDPARTATCAEVIEHLSLARASHLAPGRWRARLEGHEPRVVEVTAGRTAVVELAAARTEAIEGTVVGARTGWLVLTTVDGRAPRSFELEEGAFRGELRAGRYRAVLVDEETERSLPDVVEVRPGESRLLLHAPSWGDEVQVTLTRAGQPYTTGTLGLVALEDAARGTLIRLAPDGTEPVHRGQAPAGRFALFEGQRLLTADLRLPAEGGLVVATDVVEVRLRFALPAALRPDELLHGEMSLVPQVLPVELARRFRASEQVSLRLTRAAPMVTLQIVAGGRYLLTGETSLGPFEASVDLAPGAEVTVPLGE